MENHSSINSQIWPIVIIGGGVVGCAVARGFSLSGISVLLVEKGSDLLSGASKANSSILHTGFDAKADSLELHCIQEGREEFLRIMESMNLPLLKTSAVLLARSDRESAQLPQILESAQTNGIDNIRMLSKQEISAQVPWATTEVTGGLLIPDENVIDPWSTPLAYARQASENGAQFQFSTEVEAGELKNGIWHLETSQGQIKAEIVINATGVYGDSVERIRGPSPFSIKPRKGQFVVFDKLAYSIVDKIILPVPTEISKGVLIAPTIFGNVIAGPTAEEQESRDDVAVDTDTIRNLIEQAVRLVPGLKNCPVTTAYAGIRPATEYQDYQIQAYPQQQWISVSGIRSTGLTAALGIARYVLGLYDSQFEPLGNRRESTSVWMPNLAEHRTRPYQTGSSGEIVCHCERVTRGELEDAMEGSLPATDLDGLKRRTRCLMGRCQGFYCASDIWQLTSRRIHWPAGAESKGSQHV